MALNFVVYEKATGKILEQRSAGGCVTEQALFENVYGVEAAPTMMTLLGAVVSLQIAPTDGSMQVDTATKQIVANPNYIAPVVPSPPLV